MENFLLLLKKYSIPTIFLIVGIGVLFVSYDRDQPLEFKIGGFLILLGALLSFLSTWNRVGVRGKWVIGALSLALAGYATITSYISVDKTYIHDIEYKKLKLSAEQNLKDVKVIQIAFQKKYGKYATSWKQLIQFAESDWVWEEVKTGSTPSRRIKPEELKYLVSIGFKDNINGVETIYKANQAIDKNMSEKEAVALSKMVPVPIDLSGFKRDSVLVNFLQRTFTRNQSYLESRNEELGDFDPKVLRYIPGTDNKEWSFDYKLLNNEKTCNIKIYGTLPMSEYENGEPLEMFLGDLESGGLKGSWEDDK